LNQEKRKPVLLVENWLGFSIICIDVVWQYAGDYYAGVSPKFAKRAPTFLNE